MSTANPGYYGRGTTADTACCRDGGQKRFEVGGLHDNPCPNHLIVALRGERAYNDDRVIPRRDSTWATFTATTTTP